MTFDWLARRAAKTPRPAGPSSRLRLESLEDRTTPTTFTVNTTLDVVDPADGKQSLREAITKANNVVGTDTIVLPVGVFKIAIDGAGEDGNATGDFDITEALIVRGAGSAASIINAQQKDRLFEVIGSFAARFIDTAMRRGAGAIDGGAIQAVEADIALVRCLVCDNQSLKGGGVNAENGNVTVSATTVGRNVALGDGGGLNVGTGTLTLVDSSVRRNRSGGHGGGIAANDSVTVTNSTITGNSTTTGSGGGILAGPIVVTGSTISGNSAPGSGGGFFSLAAARVTASTVSGNTAGGGGGMFATTATVKSSMVSGNIASFNGGGISATTATLRGSTISGNSAAQFGGGGGGIHANEVTVTNCTITGNSAISGGGGIFVFSSATVTDSTVSGNFVYGYGGGIFSTTTTVTRSTVSNNHATSGGGGISAGTATVSRSTVSGNSGGSAGGGILASTTFVDNSTVSGNSTRGNGGGISANTTATVTNSTVSGNTASDNGGGISAGSAAVYSSTISGNTATGNGAGLAITTLATVLHSTIVENSAANGGGVFHDLGATQEFQVKNTIIALNLVGFGGVGPDVFGGIASQGHNLIGDGTEGTGFTHGVIGDLVGTAVIPIDPRLAPLANNGGPTKTHALLTGSPAIEHGDNAVAAATDQRGFGFKRVKDSNFDGIAIVDIGAFER